MENSSLFNTAKNLLFAFSLNGIGSPKPPNEKPAPPGQGVPVFTTGNYSVARRGLKLLCRLERDHVSTPRQLVQIVGPLLHHGRPVFHVLGAVVRPAIGILHRVG